MADALDAFQRSFFTPASQKQANKELIDAAVMNAPQFCTQTAPTGSRTGVTTRSASVADSRSDCIVVAGVYDDWIWKHGR
ncbi:MAG: hypothetical protein IPH50_02970 [Rhodanobacteraceae bacterium]|nr:hypothetical protein [Rhodanobacteraceae bacterium]